MNPDIAGIYVINLDWRPERWEMFQSSVQSWENAFGRTPERFEAIAGVLLPGYDREPWFTKRTSERRKKAWGGKAGCILSHQNIIQMAATQKWNNVLIVEDDAIMTDEMAHVWMNKLKKQVSELPEDWSAIYLFATSPTSPCRVVTESHGIKLVEASGAVGAVAYLLNGRIFDQVLKELPDESSIWSWVARHKTIDRWFSQNLARFGKVYLLAPSIVGHHCVGSSDISMTAEQDWQLDFALKDLRFVKGSAIFGILKRARRMNNALRRFFSFFRLGVKRVRGL